MINGSLGNADIEPHIKLRDVTIITSANKDGNSEIFTWSASGGIADNGSWADDKVLWAAVQSPVVGTLHDTFTLYGDNGSIKINFNGLLKPTADPDLFMIEGSWHILSGTDLYKDVVGQGKGTVMINFSQSTATSTLWGQVKIQSINLTPKPKQMKKYLQTIAYIILLANLLGAQVISPTFDPVWAAKFQNAINAGFKSCFFSAHLIFTQSTRKGVA